MERLNIVETKRFIDPYESIFGDDAANHQIAYATNTENKAAIVEGLDIDQVDPITLKIEKGTGVISDIAFTLEETNVPLNQTSYQKDATNYLILIYNYELVFNAPKIQIDLVPNIVINNGYLLLGFIDVDSDGHISGIRYENGNEKRSPSFSEYLLEFVKHTEMFKLMGDLNMNNYHIINLADGNNPQDMVNKQQMEEAWQQNYYRVRIDPTDNVDYLENKIEAGDKMTMQIINHQIRFEAQDNMCRVEQADSSYKNLEEMRNDNALSK